jgi:hypothetical protein
MADFFSRLAGRTLGLVAVARPAIAPLFAPGPQILTETEDASVARPKPVVDREEPAWLPRRSAPPVETNDPPAAVRKPAPAVAEDAAATISTEPRTATAKPPLPAIASTADPDPIKPIALNREPSAWATLPSVTPIFDPRVQEPAAQIEPASSDPFDSRVAPLATNLFPNNETLPREFRTRPSASRPNITVDREQPAPVVRVDIGRIEVRAMFPESPAPRIAPPELSSSLSLTDYLQQRDGGTR